MFLPETFAPTFAAALARIAVLRPTAYARTRNALDVQHKFVFELGWRAYFRHIWDNSVLLHQDRQPKN